MSDRRNQGTLAVTTGRQSLLVLATLALAISGCATTVGRGQSELRAGRYTEAASNFEQALKEHPEQLDALVGLGIARYAQGSYDEAVALLGRALGQDPRRAGAQPYLRASLFPPGAA